METISSSEIEKYAYCPLSWWLSRGRAEEKVEEMGREVDKREEIYKGAERIKREEEKVFTTEFLIAVLSTSAAILSLIGVGIYILQKIPASIITMTVSAIWLVAAAFFLFISLKATQIAREKRRSIDIPDGLIEYIGSSESSELRADKYGLTGKPNYVIKIEDEHIPMEIKTGRTPRGPLFSHILQLASYFVLIEENYKKPGRGILAYRDKRYRIQYTDDLKKLVLNMVQKMRDAMKTGDVHRNHNRIGKCRGCSRRKNCPESLT